MRRLVLLPAVLVPAITGLYLLLYLMRWEWHRAILAGILLVASEVVLLASVLLRRLVALDQRLDRIEAAASAAGSPGARRGGGFEVTLPEDEGVPTVASRLRATAPEPPSRFAWLKDSQCNVFLPVLLGAGVLASALAWAVESVARATASPVLEKSLDVRLTRLALPSGGLIGPPPPPMGPPRPRRSPLRRSLAVVLVLSAGAMGADVLSDATQNRPDPFQPGMETDVTIRLVGSLGDPEAWAHYLWGACAPVIARKSQGAEILHLADRDFRIDIPTAIGVYSERRLRGCLEDATVDHLQAQVLAVETHSADLDR